MNICIGGPWHGSKVLKCPSLKGWFSVKDSFGNTIKYEKRETIIGNKSYIFWIESSLTLLQKDEIRNQIYDLIDKNIMSYRID